MPVRSWETRYARWLEVTAVAGVVLLGISAFAPPIGMILFLPWLWAQMGWLLSLGRAPRTVADGVTLVRLGGMSALALAALVGGLNGWILPGLGVAVAALDLVDGWVARRWGGSAFGAVLDMESDQCFVTLLALVAVARLDLPGWILAFPALRYGHLLALQFLHLPGTDPKPKEGDNTRARLVCAFVVVVLVANLLPVSTQSVRLLLSGTALLLLFWSFTDDFVYLWRRSRHCRTAS